MKIFALAQIFLDASCYIERCSNTQDADPEFFYAWSTPARLRTPCARWTLAVEMLCTSDTSDYLKEFAGFALVLRT